MKYTSLFALGFVAVMGVSAVQAAETYSIKITNSTNSVVSAFYASPKGEESWEQDLFEDKTLAPGKSVTIQFKDDRKACYYDLRFEFRGDDLETLEDTQNLCEIEEYEIEE